MLVDRVVELVAAARGRRVLHLGCTDWPYTAEADAAGTLVHQALARAARELVGIDRDVDGLAALAALGFDRLAVGDLEDLSGARWWGAVPPGAADAADLGTYDVVIAGEVLEHLGAPRLLLEGVRPLLAPGGSLIVTVPNAYCAFRFASYALSRRRGHGEPVHPDHVAYYSEQTVRLLLERSGYVVDGVWFADLGRGHRSSAPRSWRVVNDVAVRWAPQLADGLVVRCRRDDR